MSLLRRIRENQDANLFGDSVPPTPPTPPASGPIRELWHHRAATPVYAVAMTRDNRFIIAGTRGGDVLFFDVAGRLLWHGHVEGSVYRIALAEDAHRFVVGTIDNPAERPGVPGTPGHNAYVWHFDGRLLHTFETSGATHGVDITPDGSLVAVGSQDRHLYVFDGDGAQIFKRKLVGGVYDVALSRAGDHIFAAADGHMVCAFDPTGDERWLFELRARPWAGVQVAQDAGVILVGANDDCVYCLDFAGQEHWRFDTGGHVNALAITPDGRTCAVGGKAHNVYVLNERGNVLREHRMRDDVYGLALSPDGCHLLIGANDRQIRLVDLDHDHRMWTHETSGRVHAVAMTPSGRFFTAGTDGRSIAVFNNTRVSDDMQELTLLDSPILTRKVLRMVRDDYTVAPHTGLVRWFTEFEQSLRNNQFDVCRALLDMLTNESGLDLSAEEHQYMRSLEGAYWLFRGIAYHRNAQYDEARDCYDQSKAIQQALNNQDGVGQVIAAISLLPGENGDSDVVRVAVGMETAESDEVSATQAEDDLFSSVGRGVDDSTDAFDLGFDEAIPEPVEPDRLLDEILKRPRVLGTSEKILEKRLMAASPREQFQIVVLAKDAGFITPLVRALAAEERVVRAAASAALALLNPGPPAAVLVQMLRSESFVRWQALRMLYQRAENASEAAFKTTKVQVWDAIVEDEGDHSGNPLTRRAAAQVIRVAGSEADIPWLLEHLNDPDADVQVAVIEALGVLGDRSALAPLRQIENDERRFMGRSVGHAAVDAIAMIEQRYPLPRVGQIVLCAEDPRAVDTVRQRSLFMEDTEAIYALITLEHVMLGTSVNVKWLHNDNELHTETRMVDALEGDADAGDRRFALVQDTALAFPVRFPSGDRFLGGAGRREVPFGRDRRDLFERRDDNALRPREIRERIPSRPRPVGRRGVHDYPRESRPPAPESPIRRGIERDEAPRRPEDYFPRGPERHGPVMSVPNENVERRIERDTESLFRDRDRGFGRGAPGSFRDRDTDRVGLGFRRHSGNAPSDNGPRLLGNRLPTLRERALRRGSDQERRREPLPPRRHGGQEATEDIPRFERRRPDESPFDAARRDRVSGPRRRGVPEPLPNHARQMVFVLPCPAEGWETAVYDFEASVDDAPKHRAQFKILDQVRIVALEPGQQPGLGDEDFARSHLFLVSSRDVTRYVDCQVHLENPPVDVAVTGRVFHAPSDVEVATARVKTQREGVHHVNLGWQIADWRPGPYRLEVSVEYGNTLHADIELITQYTVRNVVLCHQVDRTNGPIGTAWPFYPGDAVHCVVDLGTPPPGMRLEVTWHAKDHVLPDTEPQSYTTVAGHERYASFKLHLPEDEYLKPGHYSVVVWGGHVTREERSFEVLRPPVYRALVERVRMLWQRVEPTIKKYRIGQALLSAGTVWGLALVLLLLTYGVDYVAGTAHIDTDAILNMTRSISHVNVLWILGWLGLGSSYGVLRVRFVKDQGGVFEDGLFVVFHFLLVFGGTLLVWFHLSTLIFGPGYLWPGAIWHLPDALRWLNPPLAWAGVLVALASVEIARQGDNAKPFWTAPLYAAGGMALLALTGYVGALLGLPLGLLGVVVGSPLNAIGLNNDLGHGMLAVGGSVGFILGPVVAASIYFREDLFAFWGDWTHTRATHTGERFSLLVFMAGQNIIPLTLEQWIMLARRARRVVLLMGLLTLGVVLLFDPIFLPVLALFYVSADNAAFSDLLQSARLKPALAVAWLLIWPLLVGATRCIVLAFDLPTELAKGVRRLSRIVAASAVLVPIIVLIVSRSAMRSTQPVALNVYWVNCVTAIMLSLLLIAFTNVLRRLPGDIYNDVVSKLSLGNSEDVAILTMRVLVLIALILLPVWMWALWALLILGGAATVIAIAARIT